MAGYCEPSGKKPTSQGTESHYGDFELAAGRQKVCAYIALDVKRPGIVFDLNNINRAQGHTATKSLRRTFAEADVLDLALPAL